MQRLLLLGLNHKTAPLELREKVAFDSEKQRRAIEQLRARFSECEVVVLSTCNRVEIYAARPVHGRPRAEELMAFLAEFHGISPEQMRRHAYEKSERSGAQTEPRAASTVGWISTS